MSWENRYNSLSQKKKKKKKKSIKVQDNSN